MTAYLGLGTTGNGAGVVTPLAHKLSLAASLVKTTTPLVIRPGLFYAGTSNIVTGTAGMAYSVAAYECATQRSASAGVVLGGNDGALSVATTAAPGSNSRYDVVYHWHREFSLDGTDSNPVIGVVQGTAAASPTVPSLAAYPGAIELARILVPAGVTATNSGTTITQTAPFTTADGGTIPFRNTTEMNLFTTGLTDSLARDLSSGITYKWNGSAWRVVANSVQPIIPGTPVSTGGTASVSTNGEVTFSGATASLVVPLVFGVGYITEVEIEVLTSSAGANCTWQLVTGAGSPLATGYTTNMFQLGVTAAAVSSVASIATAWQNLRINGTIGGHAVFRVARAAETMRKSMQGGSIDGAILDFGGGYNTSILAHTGIKFVFGGSTATGVVRFRAVSNQS